jgi:hypothetical protein
MANMPGRCSLRLPATSQQPGANPRRSAQRAPARLQLRGGNSAAAHLRNADLTGLVVLAWTGDRSPVWGCTTRAGIKSPSDT